MKRLMLNLLAIVVFPFVIKAQQQTVFIYNEGGNTTFYHKIENTFMVKSNNTSDENALKTYFPRKRSITHGRLFLNTTEDSISDFIANTNSNILYSELLLAADSTVLWGTNSIFVKVNHNVNIFDLLTDNTIPYANYEQFGADPDVYLIRLNSQKDQSIYFSNVLYETDNVVFAQPNFGRLAKMRQNVYYADQWGLNNTGQYSGLTGVDINVQQAWNLSTGKGVKVAVIDEGVDLTHPDLINNMLPGYDATDGVMGGANGSCKGDDAHGTACAGIIAAEDNAIGVKGVAYEAKIIPIRIAYVIYDTTFGQCWLSHDSWIADAIYKSWHDLDADILSCSWGSGDSADIIKEAIIEANIKGRRNKGCPIFFAAGNFSPYSWTQLTKDIYPACLNEYVISVGAISPCGERKTYTSCDTETQWGSCWGKKLTIMAPGVLISTTDIQGNAGYNNSHFIHADNGGNLLSMDYTDNNYTNSFCGTSAATPYAAGVAALILALDSNFTGAYVRNAIETSAQKSALYTYNPSNSDYPNGTWNFNTGYGIIDAYSAIQTALDYDLYTRDNNNDNGLVPSDITNYGSNSPDIWVRNVKDGLEGHQIAIMGDTNYIYIRIHNKGTTNSLPNDSIKLYAKHNIVTDNPILDYTYWPNYWRKIATAQIPVIPAGNETTICLPVKFDNHFNSHTLLSKIESNYDIISIPETPNTLFNVKSNNNISIKNLTAASFITSFEPGLYVSQIMAVSNEISFNPFRFQINLNDEYSGVNILDEAEVTLILSDNLSSYWQNNNVLPTGLKQMSDNTYLVVNGNVILDNFAVPEGYDADFTLKYNFLTRKDSPTNNFFNTLLKFNILDDDEYELVGSLTIQIEKPVRLAAERFIANAGNDTVVLLNTTATLHATQINEDAIYRWYDKQRNFLYEGSNYSVVPLQTSEYILEVTAESDGYRDLDTVKVTMMPGIIHSITPNPVSDNRVTISYEYATTVTSAQLLIYNAGTASLVGNYDLSNLDNASSIEIDVSTFPTGTFSVVLVCDNNTCHAKTLIIQ